MDKKSNYCNHNYYYISFFVARVVLKYFLNGLQYIANNIAAFVMMYYRFLAWLYYLLYKLFIFGK